MRTTLIFILSLLLFSCHTKVESEFILEGDLMIRECDSIHDWRLDLDSLKKRLNKTELTERDSVAFSWEHINVETDITPVHSTWNIVYLTKTDYDKYFGAIDFKTLNKENVVYHVKFLVKKFEAPEWKVLKVISVEKRKGMTNTLIC